jgi:hypothetical protein
MDIQVCTHCLLGRKVINECLCDTQTALFSRSAAAACATRLNRVEVFGERRVLEIKDSFRGDCIPEPLQQW